MPRDGQENREDLAEVLERGARTRDEARGNAVERRPVEPPKDRR